MERGVIVEAQSAFLPHRGVDLVFGFGVWRGLPRRTLRPARDGLGGIEKGREPLRRVKTLKEKTLKTARVVTVCQSLLWRVFAGDFYARYPVLTILDIRYVLSPISGKSMLNIRFAQKVCG